MKPIAPLQSKPTAHSLVDEANSSGVLVLDSYNASAV